MKNEFEKFVDYVIKHDLQEVSLDTVVQMYKEYNASFLTMDDNSKPLKDYQPVLAYMSLYHFLSDVLDIYYNRTDDYLLPILNGHVGIFGPKGIRLVSIKHLVETFGLREDDDLTYSDICRVTCPDQTTVDNYTTYLGKSNLYVNQYDDPKDFYNATYVLAVTKFDTTDEDYPEKPEPGHAYYSIDRGNPTLMCIENEMGMDDRFDNPEDNQMLYNVREVDLINRDEHIYTVDSDLDPYVLCERQFYLADFRYPEFVQLDNTNNEEFYTCGGLKLKVVHKGHLSNSVMTPVDNDSLVLTYNHLGRLVDSKPTLPIQALKYNWYNLSRKGVIYE